MFVYEELLKSLQHSEGSQTEGFGRSWRQAGEGSSPWPCASSAPVSCWIQKFKELTIALVAAYLKTMKNDPTQKKTKLMKGFILINNAEKNEQTTDEEDPYAAYVIPDDLMW